MSSTSILPKRRSFSHPSVILLSFLQLAGGQDEKQEEEDKDEDEDEEDEEEDEDEDEGAERGREEQEAAEPRKT